LQTAKRTTVFCKLNPIDAKNFWQLGAQIFICFS
jgi:hypothetical protein